MTDQTLPQLIARTVASSVEELVGNAERVPMTHTDSRSGATFERVLIDGEPHVVKYLHVDDDWIMRCTGDLMARPLTMWSSGLLDALPPCFDHAVVGAAAGLGRNAWGAALLMRDVSADLVPSGDDPIPLAQHLRFMEHMAALHTSFWGWHDDLGLAPLPNRLVEFNPESVSCEERKGWPEPVPKLAIQGWARFPEVAGARGAGVLDVVHDVAPLVDALDACPQTFLHGDWKMGNLGSAPDGRTVVLDWAMPGQGCPTLELAWYLALNRARLPHAKEAAIEAYRTALEDQGVDTDPWFDRALDLALLTGLVWFGWEKALGGPGPELDWWLDAAQRGLTRL
jgi:hypothetical protein